MESARRASRRAVTLGCDRGVALGGDADSLDEPVRAGVREQEALRAGSERTGDVVGDEGGDDNDCQRIVHVGSGKLRHVAPSRPGTRRGAATGTSPAG